MKIDPVKDLKIRDSIRIYDSGGISRATDKGMTTKAHDLSTPEACSGSSPWNLGPSIVIVKIRDHIVTYIVWANLYRTRPDPQDLATYKYERNIPERQ
jgi:hypothetical protein